MVSGFILVFLKEKIRKSLENLKNNKSEFQLINRITIRAFNQQKHVLLDILITIKRWEIVFDNWSSSSFEYAF